jgi:hypothetical protein
MAAITTTEVAKVVRKVLGEAQGDDNEATLRALQRVTELLLEKVIPQLPDQPTEQERDEEHLEEEAPSAIFDEQEAPVDVYARDVTARGYPHVPCRKGGPTPRG